MIIKLFAFTLISIAILCGTVPVSMAVGDSDGQSSQDELTVTRNHLQQAKQKIEELERQLASSNLENAKRRIGELVIQLHAKENELNALRSSAYENSKKLRDDLTSQTEELAQAKRRVAEIEQQLAGPGKGQELTQAKRRAAEAEQQTVRKEQELAQVKRRLADVEQQMAGKDQELAQAKRRTAEAEQQTSGKDQELAQAKRRLADIEQQMAGRDQELTQARRRAAEAEQQTARKDQELAQIKDDLKQVTQKLADLSPQLMARDAELARTKQLLADLERHSSKQVEPVPVQEESPPSLPLPSLDQNLSVTNLLSPSPSVADDAEASLSSDLGKMSESLASLLQPELKKGSATLRQRGTKLTLSFVTGELFVPGEATMTLGGASLLEQIGMILHGFRYQSVEVAGNTDNTTVRNDPRKGARDHSDLSQARAERASQTLINSGLEADRVKAVGYADTKQTGTTDTEKGRSKTRRVEIVITQWSESGSTVGDTKSHIGKKLQGFSTQPVTHR